jgi:hypothetical protein
LAELNRKNEGAHKPALAARIAIDTGPAVLDAGGEIFGDVANVAARAQALADPGAVGVTARVQRQVAGLFVVLRGIAERGALAPLFVLVTARPEFRPPWGMRSHHGIIALAPLDRQQVRDTGGGPPALSSDRPASPRPRAHFFFHIFITLGRTGRARLLAILAIQKRGLKQRASREGKCAGAQSQ